VAGAIEGEKTVVLSKAGKTEIQGLGDKWSNEAQLWWTEAQMGDELVLGFDVAAVGKKHVVLGLTKARDYAVVQVSVNGQKAGKPVDLFNPDVTLAEVDLGEFDLKAGQNKLTVRVTDANEKAVKAYMFGLDYVLLK